MAKKTSKSKSCCCPGSSCCGNKAKKAKKVKAAAPKIKPTVKLPEKLAAYLDKAGIKHDVLEHKTVYTAIDAAATLRRKVGDIAKSLLVKADKDYFVVVLPADHNLDMNKLGQVIGKARKKEVKVIKIPGEKIMAEVIKAKNKAMTAFGGLHQLPVVAEKNLEKAKKLILSSGSYNHSVEMKLKDFLKLENALMGKFGIKKKVKLVNAK